MKNKTLYELYQLVTTNFCDWEVVHASSKKELVRKIDKSDYSKLQFISDVGSFADMYISYAGDEPSVEALADAGITFLKVCMCYSDFVTESFFNMLEGQIAMSTTNSVCFHVTELLDSVHKNDISDVWANLLFLAKVIGVDDLVLEIQKLFYKRGGITE